MTAIVAIGRRLRDRLGRALEHPAVMPGVAVASGVFVVWLVSLALGGAVLVGYDAHAYYQAAALDDPYRATINGGFDGVGGLYEFKYPPPLAQVLHPVWVIGMSWPAFLGLWTVLLLGSLAWMGRRWTLLLLLFPPVLGELWFGNLNLLLGVAVIVGMRWPAAWSFILLTKITPGIGLVWFAVRREWRSLAVALIATVAVVGVSYALAPWLWADFLEASMTQVDATVNVPRQAVPIPLPLRLVLSAVLAAWAARTDRAWVLPIAVGLSVPFLWWNAFAVMVAAVPLYAWRPAVRTATPAAGPTALPQAQPG